MNSILTIIVPVGPLVGRTENLFNWLKVIEHKPLDVILVLDDKIDGTREVISEKLATLNYKNITFIAGTFGGPGLTRNKAIPLIKSKWFTFWDADDLPNIDRFLKMIDEATYSGFKVAMGQFSVVDSGRHLTRYFTRMGSKDWELSLAQTPGIWRFAFSREEFQQLQFPALSMGEDQVYLASLNLAQENVYETNEIVYEYFVGMSQQLTQSKSTLNDLVHASEILNKISNGKLGGNQRLASFMFVKQQITQIKKGTTRVSLGAIFIRLLKFLWAEPGTRTAVILKILLQKRKYGYPNQIFLQGGLGNQLFQISALKSFSGDFPCQVLSERNSFDKIPTMGEESYLNKQTNSIEKMEITRNLLHKKFLNFALRISASYSDSDTVLKRAFLDILRGLIQEFYIFSRSPQKLFIARGLGEDVAISVNPEGKFFVGYFQSYQYAMSIREPIQELVSSRIEEVDWLKKLKTENSGSEVLVLQVRLGDYLRNPKFGSLDSNYFHRTLNRADNLEGPGKYWLFSDDEQGAKERLTDSSKRNFEVVVPDNSLDIDVLCAMTLGKKFVISNSTFGWWGAFLSESGLEDGSIYYPNPWFQTISSPLNLTPPNWNASPIVVS
jgi:glycosyltransferase involved in cell wall biosynthesis